MQKIAKTEVKALLKQAGASIRTLVEQRDEARAKVAFYEREERISKIAHEMEEKKLNDDLSYEEKLASLRQASNLDVTEEAVKMASPQGFHIGHGGEDPMLGADPRSNLEMFIATGDAPE